MGIRCDEYNGVCVVAVDGNLAGDAVAEARGVVDAALSRREARGIVFDLGDCGFVDSAALELLCLVRRRCDDAGTRVTLAGSGRRAQIPGSHATRRAVRLPRRRGAADRRRRDERRGVVREQTSG